MRRATTAAASTAYCQGSWRALASGTAEPAIAPLVVAMLSHTLEAAAARTASHGPLAPTLRLLLDEAANIAPLRDLPHHLSQAAGHGVRIATIWQSLAQARERYHDGADSILANSTAKLFMGPITDNTTRSYLDQLLGQELQHHDDRDSWRPKAPAQALQQLGDRPRATRLRQPPARRGPARALLEKPRTAQARQ